MKSDYALSRIEELEHAGLHPTPEDIIRLNAFGLAIDAAAGKSVGNSLYHLPRVAVLKQGVFLRQPTIGHEIWITSVLRFVDADDPLTLLAVNCYALSRPPSDLPDPSDPANVKTAIDGFCETMNDFTREQLYVAYDWVKFGMNASALELRARRTADDTEDDDGGPEYDHATCVALGCLHRGAAVLWGLSLAELRGMTQDQLRQTIRLAAKHQKVELDDGTRIAQGEFEDVFYEIKARLEKEKKEKEVTNG